MKEFAEKNKAITPTEDEVEREFKVVILFNSVSDTLFGNESGKKEVKSGGPSLADLRRF